MSDQATSGEPTPATATAAGAPPQAAPAGDTRPIGSFGNARGSGLARGKRATPTPTVNTAAVPNAGSYKPMSVEVITPQREYTHPFASKTPASPINEPAPQAANVLTEIPVATASIPSPRHTPAAEMFPFAPPAPNEPKPSSPQSQPQSNATVERAEIKILPPADVKRPAVSWGDGTHDEDTRPQPDQRPSFQPERREPRKFEPREPKAFVPREPRREPAFEQRGPLPHKDRDRPRTEPAKSSGGFISWLKNLFGGKSTELQPTPSQDRDRQNRDGEFQRHRQRGGRGRGGYQGDNRGPRDSQPRDPRDVPQGGAPGYPNGDQQGERRFEGGGGRRRRRGGRGRNRDDRGGPRSEGQQGGGAI